MFDSGMIGERWLVNGNWQDSTTTTQVNITSHSILLVTFHLERVIYFIVNMKAIHMWDIGITIERGISTECHALVV